MLERLLKLYVMAMATGVTSPLPHLFGPPGVGKSTVAQQLAELLNVNLHIINVARISPLDVEGVQMPHGTGEELVLRMLPATFWTQLRENDVLLLDEFLRGFPEVYNAILDILTSRRAGEFRLPKVFILAASNTTVAYDKALEDRLLHIPVPDIRRNKAAHKQLRQLIVDELGLLPVMVDSTEMSSMVDNEIAPMFEILDGLGKASSSPGALKGCSPRNLIGQAKLRDVQSRHLKEVLQMNNLRAMSAGKAQYVLLYDGKSEPAGYRSAATKLVGNERLTPLQALNLNLNLQLLELEDTRKEKGIPEDDPFDGLDDAPF